MNVVAAPGQGKTSSGNFKAVQDALLAELPAEGEAKKKNVGLENGVFGIIVNLLNPNTGGNSEIENETKVSICGDSKTDDLINGIAGILEGFGLLNYETDEVTLPEGLKTVLEAALSNAGTGENPAAETAIAAGGEEEAVLPQNGTALTAGQNASDEIARMPKGDQPAPLPQKAQEAIGKLVAEYLCSFANSNKNGATGKVPADAGEIPAAADAVAAQTGGNAVQAGGTLFETGTEGQAEAAMNGGSPGVQAKKPAADRILELLKAAVTASKGSGDTETAVKSAVKTTEPEKQEAESAKTPVTNTAETPRQAPVENAAKAQKANTAPKATSSDMADNVAKIVEKITSQLKDGQREFEVTLKPEHLGKLSIKLTMSSDGLRANLKAADASVKTMLANELPALQESLREKGIDVAKIDVAYESQSFNASGQPHRQAKEESKSRGRGYYENSDLPAYGVSFDAAYESDLILRNSSVEFKA